MKIHVVGSGSSGNSYILETENDALVIDAGCHWQEIQRALNFNIRKVEGLLVSHNHGDHNQSAKDFIRAGIPAFGYGANNLVDRLVFRVGNYRILPVRVVHDVDTFAFLINHPEAGNIAYVTDTHYLPVRFAGVNYWMLEANYDPEIMDANIEAGRLPGIVRNRVLSNHMSIETAIDCLKANDLSGCCGIMLLHLSNGNGNAEDFKNRTIRATGLPVEIARPGLTVSVKDSIPF